MCGMQSDMNVRSGSANLIFKFIPGADKIFVHVFKSGWQIPKGTAVPVALVFDGSTPWSATAIGSTMDFGTGLVAFSVHGGASVRDLLTEFGAANTRSPVFTQGNERPWTFNMSGSREVSASFAQCIIAIDKASGTQPYGNSSTQPFGNAAPAPTQPYGAQPAPKPAARPQPRENGGI